MATFKDITGWFNELQEYLSSDEFESMVPKDSSDHAKNPSMKMPIEWVPELVQLIMRHKELRDAYTEYGEWSLANNYDSEGNQVDEYDENTEPRPAKAREITRWFPKWFVYFGKKPRQFVASLGLIDRSIAEIVVLHGNDVTLTIALKEIKRIEDDYSFDLKNLEVLDA